MRPSDKRIPYRIIKDPTYDQVPIYLREARMRVPLHRVAVLQVAVVARAPGATKDIIFMPAALIANETGQDWDYNTLEPNLVQLQQTVEFICAKSKLNLISYIDPEKVPPGKARPL